MLSEFDGVELGDVKQISVFVESVSSKYLQTSSLTPNDFNSLYSMLDIVQSTVYSESEKSFKNIPLNKLIDVFEILNQKMNFCKICNSKCGTMNKEIKKYLGKIFLKTIECATLSVKWLSNYNQNFDLFDYIDSLVCILEGLINFVDALCQIDLKSGFDFLKGVKQFYVSLDQECFISLITEFVSFLFSKSRSLISNISKDNPNDGEAKIILCSVVFIERIVAEFLTDETALFFLNSCPNIIDHLYTLLSLKTYEFDSNCESILSQISTEIYIEKFIAHEIFFTKICGEKHQYNHMDFLLISKIFLILGSQNIQPTNSIWCTCNFFVKLFNSTEKIKLSPNHNKILSHKQLSNNLIASITFLLLTRNPLIVSNYIKFLHQNFTKLSFSSKLITLKCFHSLIKVSNPAFLEKSLILMNNMLNRETNLFGKVLIMKFINLNNNQFALTTKEDFKFHRNETLIDLDKIHHEINDTKSSRDLFDEQTEILIEILKEECARTVMNRSQIETICLILLKIGTKHGIELPKAFQLTFILLKLSKEPYMQKISSIFKLLAIFKANSDTNSTVDLPKEFKAKFEDFEPKQISIWQKPKPKLDEQKVINSLNSVKKEIKNCLIDNEVAKQQIIYILRDTLSMLDQF